MPSKHARLSPSSSHIWLHCPPSVRLSEKYEDQTSIYAEEGTEAHSLCEYELRKILDEKVADPRPNLRFYDQVMQDSADGYVETVMGIYDELKTFDESAVVFVEQQVDFSEYVPGGFGTSDAVIIGGPTMVICDFKYGSGVEVSATENTQLMCYALGCYLAFSPIYDISDIRLVIYQPRLSNYSVWECSADDLLAWAEEELRPKAKLAEAGEGTFAAGEWCRFCKARHTCRARSLKNLELAQYDFKLPPELSDDEVSDILNLLDDLEKWASDIREYAVKTILSGNAIDGWKLVEGRSNRKYTDEQAVASAVTDAGYDPYEHKVLGITAMTSILGKKKFNELLGELVYKPAGKPVLVRSNDKRPEYSNAKTDFMEVNDNDK